MNEHAALDKANVITQEYVRSRDIPVASLALSADSGKKIGEHIAALHQTLFAYFKGIDV